MGRTDKEIYRVIDNVNSYYRINSESKKELLLNKYPNAAAAYSLRLLDGYYRGPLVRVRRDDDGAEVDVYPDYNNQLSLDSLVTNVADIDDTTTDPDKNADATFLKSLQSLGEFVHDDAYDSVNAAVTATVCVWYDQANENHAKQVVATQQPKIYDSSTGVVTENGKPAVNLDGVNDFLQASALLQGAVTVLLVYNRSNTSYILDATGPNRLAIGNVTNSTNFQVYVSAAVNTTSNNINQQNLGFVLADTTNSFAELNGSTNGPGDSGITANSSTIFIGSRINGSAGHMSGVFQEIIYYNSDQSTNRTGIEQDINNHYQIEGYTPPQPLLDEFGGAAAAYSLRLLSSTYTGPLVRIRRTIDNTEVDVYPDSDGQFSIYSTIQDGGTELTTGVTGGSTDKTTLHEFLYGQDTDCMVVVWYDQSGNSNDATQTTTSRQPKVYDSAAGVVLENGKPILQSYAGVDFPTINYTGVTTQSVYAVGQIDTSSAALGQFNNSTLLAASSGGTGGIGLTATFYKNGTSYTPANQGAVYTDLYQTQSLIAANFNGSSYTSFSVSYPLLSAYNMFSLNEWLMFDNQDNRAAIETNINDYYDIF